MSEEQKGYKIIETIFERSRSIWSGSEKLCTASTGKLLILHYGSFKKAIEGISEMKPGHIIKFTDKINEEGIKIF